MEVLKLEQEIKKEYKKAENWLDQFGHFGFVLLASIGTFICVGTMMQGAVITIVIMFSDQLNNVELLSFFKSIAPVVYIVAAFVTVIFSIPRRLRNIFKEAAESRVNRQKIILDQASLVESVLMRHKLITSQEAATAKKDRES